MAQKQKTVSSEANRGLVDSPGGPGAPTYRPLFETPAVPLKDSAYELTERGVLRLRDDPKIQAVVEAAVEPLGEIATAEEVPTISKTNS